VDSSADITRDKVGAGIAGRTWGNVPEPDRIVVLVHGYGEHGGRYEEVGRWLAREGAVVYAVDHRGHGRSTGKPALVEDIEVLVDDLAGVVAVARTRHTGLAVALLGHSMGAVVALRYAQRGDHGLAALVLSSPLIGGSPAIEDALADDRLAEVSIDSALRSRDASVGAEHADDPLVYHGLLRRETIEAIFAGARAVVAGPGLGELPTLWLHGEDDGLAPLVASREAIDRIRGDLLEERVYRGARHELLNEINRIDVFEAIAAFLGQYAPATE
jgi:alpha-beta hydrolase superfamily lysophospholipase